MIRSQKREKATCFFVGQRYSPIKGIMKWSIGRAGLIYYPIGQPKTRTRKLSSIRRANQNGFVYWPSCTVALDPITWQLLHHRASVVWTARVRLLLCKVNQVRTLPPHLAESCCRINVLVFNAAGNEQIGEADKRVGVEPVDVPTGEPPS